ncbi:hypothetical protein D9757_012176 [Collybiopsis confluens]|uniref:Amidohydrolase-related domain-containing protein n=1 Tax=Collybiopsis confluens TaxID=2823264 RepID=A0A8H5GK03_9AGAR|nr:hypothetical protein D9757_013831 [Collybiopsis confluens]KAF5366514.1 hypothetical protein D9757_012176 [Collybiopsis confluens]
MRISFLCLFALSSRLCWARKTSNITQIILENAKADNIDLTVLPFLDDALNAIVTTYTDANQTSHRRANGSIIDVHGHIVPDWYRAIQPITGGSPTPQWDLESWLAFMDSEGIGRAIFSFSCPAANVFMGNKIMTVALARLMNEQLAAVARAVPNQLQFYGIVPLPYADEAIVEAKYAVEHLGAVGFFLTSNFEDNYLGSSVLRPFLAALENMPTRQIVLVHPTTPYIRFDGQLIEANPFPTLFPSGEIEFYFETARTLQDLIVTQTILNFTNIDYIIPHVGGAFPATADRTLKALLSESTYNATLETLRTRFWWDSAGPTYYHQVAGLLGYGIPKTQLLFGTDFPYAKAGESASLGAIEDSDLLSVQDRKMLFTTNAEQLFGH